MEFKVGDEIKYYFLNPTDKNKDFVRGVVSFINNGLIGLTCEDNTKLFVSFKNTDRIVPLNGNTVASEFDYMKAY